MLFIEEAVTCSMGQDRWHQKRIEKLPPAIEDHAFISRARRVRLTLFCNVLRLGLSLKVLFSCNPFELFPTHITNKSLSDVIELPRPFESPF